VRRIVLLTVAGVASATASAMGCVVWHATGAGSSPVLLLKLFCIFPALGLVAFCLYFAQPRFALITAFLLLTGSFLTAYFVNLSPCLKRACSTTDSVRMGWQTLAHGRTLWALAIAAVCLLMDHTAPAPHAASALAPEDSDHDLRT
jgi:hypothetical protein